ncbi:hypothetical protein ABET51_02725 [Metabacillus fastidiosus]|uniref:hypothetical protein n=1 Tax=Metabacillus fastidiosus TaxID=1458 RepID=UPI003D2A14B4
MTLIELKKILEATGYPVAYSHFDEQQTSPFITYLVHDSPSFFADNKVYKKINDVLIELYTTKKDLVAEKKLEDLLDENEISYEADETFIESEKLFQRIYEVRLI